MDKDLLERIENSPFFGLIKEFSDDDVEIGDDYIWIINENGFGLLIIIDHKSRTMRFIDSYI